MKPVSPIMTTAPKPTRKRPGPKPRDRMHLGARISPKTMARIDAIVEHRRESVTATSKNAIVEELLALALDALDRQEQGQLPLERT
jgi:hypothetical protein